jgi:aminopeptidase N
MKRFIIFVLIGLFPPLLLAQRPDAPLTRADTLRGMQSPERTCYDVTYYHLDVRIDPSDSSVRGYNDITFRVDRSFRKMQLDLFRNMSIEKVAVDGVPVPWTREFDAFFLETPSLLQKGETHTVRAYYSGKPQVARRPPWGGGF